MGCRKAKVYLLDRQNCRSLDTCVLVEGSTGGGVREEIKENKTRVKFGGVSYQQLAIVSEG